MIESRIQAMSGREFVTRRQLAQKYGVTPSTITNWVREGRLPEPLKLSQRTHRWDGQEVEEMLSSMRAGA